MANIPAAQAADFNSSSTWVGGVVPGPNDVAFANGFNVTISDTRTVQAISNAAGTGITVGGTFSVLNGCNLTCTNANGVIQGGTTTSCVTTASLAIGQLATINANITHSVNTANSYNVNHSNLGTLVLNGNLSGNPLNNLSSAAALLSGAGYTTINGNITAGVPATQATHGLLITGANTVTITSSSITGSGVSVANAIKINNSNATVNVTGIVNGGHAISNDAGTLNVTGPCQANAGGPAIASGTTTQITRLSGPFLRSSSGVSAVIALAWRWTQNRNPTYFEVPNWNNTASDNLRTSDNMPTGGYPTISNVLSTAPAYGDSSQYQGTYVSPATGSVASGVAYGPSGTLTGTAVLTAAAVRSAIGMGSANLDTQLANKATVDQVAAIVEGATSA